MDPQGDDQRFKWENNREPAQAVIFITDPDLKLCGGIEGALACATTIEKTCIVATSTSWTKESWNIVRHELRHCAGWSH